MSILSSVRRESMSPCVATSGRSNLLAAALEEAVLVFCSAVILYEELCLK